MDDRNRQHKRIKKPINISYCIASALPKKWDMSVIENISAGGVKFIAPTDLDLNGKIVLLQVKIPALAPQSLEIEALVLEAKPRFNPKFSDIRAKFINISGVNKEHLTVVEKMAALQEIKDAK